MHGSTASPCPTLPSPPETWPQGDLVRFDQPSGDGEQASPLCTEPPRITGQQVFQTPCW